MSNTKNEIMSLRLADEMIFSLCARSHVHHVGFYTIPYIQAHIFGVGSANARKQHRLTPEKSHHVIDQFVHDGHWMGSIFNSYPYDLILLH
jgi:hypothetical protein